MRARARWGWIVCLLFAWVGSVRAQSSAATREVQDPVEQSALAFTISGRAIDADGRRLDNLVLVIGTEANGGFSAETSEIAPAPDGTFQTGKLPPGFYVLEVFTLPESLDNPGGAAGFAAVTLKDADVTGITITTRRPASLTGRVRFESERDAEASHPSVTIHAMLAIDGMRENHVKFARSSDDGSFELSGLHGPRLIRATVERRTNSAPCWLKAVLLDGVDVTNVPVDFVAKPHSRLEVVLAERPTAIVGIVNDEAGLPVEGAQVVVFPKDESLWAAWSTAVHAGTTDENGRFWFVDAIPPGDYVAIALRAGTYPSDSAALDDLRRLDRLATAFVVLQSRVARIELTINRAR
jgi:hypothetical protein